MKNIKQDLKFDKAKFNPIINSGEEVGGYTIALNEVDIYGEGETIEDAENNLIDSVIELIDIYAEKIDILSQVYNAEKKNYIMKLIRTGKDKEKIRKAIGL